MSLADLQAALSQASNLSQLKGLSAAYNTLLGGIPTLDGFANLMATNNATNFGAGPGPLFNDENIIINTINALYQGNPFAKAAFNAIVGSGTSTSDLLTAVYNFVVPATSRTQEGLDYFIGQSAFYTARAKELDIPDATGAALVAFASLTKIAVDNGLGGLGDSLNDLIKAVNNGSAGIPQGGPLFTPIEVADGTQFDADDSPAVGSGPIYTIYTGSYPATFEGNSIASSINYIITRTGDISAAGSVDFNVSGIIDNNDIYLFFPTNNSVKFYSNSVTIPFLPGESTAILTVETRPDLLAEPNELVTFTLSNVVGGGIIGESNTEKLMIMNDDNVTPVVYNVEASSESAVEGSNNIGNTVTYTVVRTGNISGPGTVAVTFGGTASLDVDYTSSLSGGVVSFAIGEDRQSFTVTTTPDLGSELNETVRVSLGAIIDGSGTLGNTSSATATITDDDTEFLNTFYSVSANPATVTEGNSGSGSVIAYTISRTGDTSDVGAVNVILQGTADAQIDYSLPFFGSVVRFAAGQTEFIYNLTVRPDTTSEADETVTISLDSFPHGAQLSEPSSATAIILNDDQASPTPLPGLLIGVIDMTTQVEPAGF